MKSSIILTLAAGFCASAAGNCEKRNGNWIVGQPVKTESGTVTGKPSVNDAEVSEYLGIPFGKAPIGDLRFAPPVKFVGNGSLDGAFYGPNCPVKESDGSFPSFEALDAANVTGAGIATLFLLSASGEFSEDCLNLNVWTKPQTGEAKKAVLIWIYGGGFSTGAGSVNGYKGANLAAEQDVVVVTFNYRLSILGFPGNPDSTANLAILDQRLAIEWVRDNIEQFGGDPSRITLFGQSAGAASIDIYSYAFTKDPIVAGLIPESGNMIGWGLPNSKEASAKAWYNVSSTLGCGDASSDSKAVLSCMRGRNYSDVLSAIPASSGTAAILGFFIPTVDDVVVFSNYTSRTPANVPMLIGNNDYEAGLFRTQFALSGLFFPGKFWTAFNLQAFTCPTGIRANLSVAAGVPTWRYRYHGVFPNLNIADDAGAWHTAEVPMLFNTVPVDDSTTPEQVSIGKYMRGGWAAFAKDPKEGLTKYGWPQYNYKQDSLVRLAYQNITGPNLINPYRYDADCVFVNVSNTDSSIEIPDFPDLGAGVQPTGMPTAPGAGGAGSGPASPSPSTPNVAARAKAKAVSLVSFAGVMAAAHV